MSYIDISSRRAKSRLKELVDQIEKYEQKLKINEFKTDWDKEYAQIMVKSAEEAIVALIRNLI